MDKPKNEPTKRPKDSVDQFFEDLWENKYAHRERSDDPDPWTADGDDWIDDEV